MRRILALLLALAIPAGPLAAESATPSGVVAERPPAWLAALSTLKEERESRHVSVVTDPGITATDQLPAGALRAARKEMIARTGPTDEALRALALAGDGLAAVRWLNRVDEGMEAPLRDIALIGAVGAGAGRIGALDDMIRALRAMSRGDLPRGHAGKVTRVLYAHAWAGNGLALQAVIDLNGDGRLFGRLSSETREKIELALSEGDGHGSLRLAAEIMADPVRRAAEKGRALRHLEAAAASSRPEIQAVARTLIGVLEG